MVWRAAAPKNPFEMEIMRFYGILRISVKITELPLKSWFSVIFLFFPVLHLEIPPRNHWFNNTNGRSGAPGPQKYHFKHKTTIFNEKLVILPTFHLNGGFMVLEGIFRFLAKRASQNT